jgi:hypothetical protein
MEQGNTEACTRVHTWRIPDREYQRMAARRGHGHAYPRRRTTGARSCLISRGIL